MIKELYDLITDGEKELGVKLNVDLKIEKGCLKTMICTLGRTPIVGYGFMLTEDMVSAAFEMHFRDAVMKLENEIKGLENDN